jgi:hypothetical protein
VNEHRCADPPPWILLQREITAKDESTAGGVPAARGLRLSLPGDRPDRRQDGRARFARTLVAWVRAAARFGGVSVRRVEVNGQPGAMVLDPAGRLVGVLALDIADGQVQAVSSVVNPDKLRHLGPLADLGGLRPPPMTGSARATRVARPGNPAQAVRSRAPRSTRRRP